MNTLNKETKVIGRLVILPSGKIKHLSSISNQLLRSLPETTEVQNERRSRPKATNHNYNPEYIPSPEEIKNLKTKGKSPDYIPPGYWNNSKFPQEPQRFIPGQDIWKFKNGDPRAPKF